MAVINKGITLSEVVWSNTVQYAILQGYVPGGVGGEAVYFCPVVTDAGIQYTANKVDSNGAPIQPTKGTAPSAEPTAWTITSGGVDVTGTLLTGLVPAAGTIDATNTILEGFNKTQGNFNGIGTSYLRAVPQGAFDQSLSATPVDFPINDATAMTIVKSSDITVDLGNFYTLPAGHIYIAEVVMRGNTFDSPTTTISMQFNLNAVLQPQVAMSNAGNNVAVGSQGKMTALIDTTGGAVQFKIQAVVTVGVSAKVSSSGAVSTGGGFAINIYSIR